MGEQKKMKKSNLFNSIFECQKKEITGELITEKVLMAGLEVKISPENGR